MGVSGIVDIGGGRDVGCVRLGCDVESLSFGFLDSDSFRLAERRPDGSEDFGLEMS